MPAESGQAGRQDRDRSQFASQPRRALGRHAPVSVGASVAGRKLERRGVPRDRIGGRPAARRAKPRRAGVRREHEVLRRRPGVPRFGGGSVHARAEPAHVHRQQRLRSGSDLPDGGERRQSVVDRGRGAITTTRTIAQRARSGSADDRCPESNGRARSVQSSGARYPDEFANSQRLRLDAGGPADPDALRRQLQRPQPADLPPSRRSGRAVRAVPVELPSAAGDRTHEQLGRSLGQLPHLSGIRRKAAGVRSSRVRAHRGLMLTRTGRSCAVHFFAASSAARRRSRTRTRAAGRAATTGRGR